MIKNHIVSLLTNVSDIQLTGSQRLLAEKLGVFITSQETDTVFIIRGYAGTGKTTMISHLTKTLDHLLIKSVLLAPTGRAAKVLSGYTGKNTHTIHKKIYRQKSSVDGLGTFVLDKNLHKYTYFIVDESSMISNQAGENNIFGSGKLLDDLMEYVFSGEGCRLILAGDTAQLPPVGLDVSPALDRKILEDHGFNVVECELIEVVRQEKESIVLMNATRFRDRIFDELNPKGFFRIDVPDGGDLIPIQGSELMEKIGWCYDRYGISETIVVTRSNKRANLFNKGIRNSILYRDSEISRGDLLMVVKNNYFWIKDLTGLDFIANGDIAEITHIYGYETIYGFRFANVSLRFPDYEDLEADCKLILDSLFMESAAMTKEDSFRLYEEISADYADIKNKRERWKKLRNDPYYNALQVKFAYAVTCHKAQGGQWQAVFMDTGYLTEEMIDREFLRWMYTAFTRPREVLFLVNFDKKFFE